MKALRQLKRIAGKALAWPRSTATRVLARLAVSASPAFRRALLEQESISRSLVAQAYAAVLQREVDPSGVDHYARAMGGGASLQDVITHLIQSDEFEERIISERTARHNVTAAYEGVLGRSPDPDGLDNHVRAMAGGTSLSEVIAALIRSEEFAGRITSIDGIARSLIHAAYEGVLDRSPDPEGFEIYGNALRKGMLSPAALLREFQSYRPHPDAALQPSANQELEKLAELADGSLREVLAARGCDLQIGQERQRSQVPPEALGRRIAATLVTLSARDSNVMPFGCTEVSEMGSRVPYRGHSRPLERGDDRRIAPATKGPEPSPEESYVDNALAPFPAHKTRRI